MPISTWLSGNIKKVTTHKHPVRFFVGHGYKKIIRSISTLFPKFLTIFPVTYVKGNFKLRLAPTLLSYVMYEYPHVRQDDEEFIARLLGPGDVYVDVGANVGNTTLAAAYAIGGTGGGHVYAYEAHPRTYGYLLNSLEANKQLANIITPYNVALGEQEGYMQFTDLQNDDINKMTRSGGITVKVETLDQQHFPEKINLLKIDVEGYEYFVLRGASKTLAKTETIIFESYINNYEVFNVTLPQIIAHLKSFGFSIYTEYGLVLKEIDETYSSSVCEDLIATKNLESLLSRGLTLTLTP